MAGLREGGNEPPGSLKARNVRQNDGGIERSHHFDIANLDHSSLKALFLCFQATKLQQRAQNLGPRLLFSIGGNIIIRIPDVDRGEVDLRNLLGVLLETNDDDLYRIGTEDEILNKLYCRSEFDVQ
ncbi:hypothetical protein ANN_01134 [Periplaneta americana]|uniref:Uncharacterized protein n=1 Tax=Periplaneta americana TaxID=6978 RepID=A0ABQ8TWS1_PERAM|nr:hypothetical protein ANN_01134 [Periplaneta americana]